MSLDEGRLDCMNVVDLSLSESGRSLRIELRGSVPPYESTTMTLQNAFCIRLSQAPGDEYPYFIPEMHWRRIPDRERAELLREAQYDFFDEQNNPLIADRELIVLEMEGALCGQIVAERILWE